MNGQVGAWTMLEQSVEPDMMNLQDLDPEFVADRANQEAFASEGQVPEVSDLKAQQATLIQEESLKKLAASEDFQRRAYMMNRSQGK